MTHLRFFRSDNVHFLSSFLCQVAHKPTDTKRFSARNFLLAGRNKSSFLSSLILERRTDDGIAMCEKCVEDELQIAHYQQLARMVPDQRTLDAIDHQIMELRSAKAARHPAREE
jgi:hypothetical protein